MLSAAKIFFLNTFSNEVNAMYVVYRFPPGRCGICPNPASARAEAVLKKKLRVRVQSTTTFLFAFYTLLFCMHVFIENTFATFVDCLCLGVGLGLVYEARGAESAATMGSTVAERVW